MYLLFETMILKINLIWIIPAAQNIGNWISVIFPCFAFTGLEKTNVMIPTKRSVFFEGVEGSQLKMLIHIETLPVCR